MSKYTARRTDSNGLGQYTAADHASWQRLIERQDKIIQGCACKEYLDGLALLNMPRDRVPQCQDINAVLLDLTGWSVVPVPVLIKTSQFYQMLAKRQFPAASFIRTPEDLDYVTEPDIFHELYGHCPLLTNPSYANFVQWYGVNALLADKLGRNLLARLFWYTIETGLIKNGDDWHIYGGSILSSKEETIYAVQSEQPKRLPLDVLYALRTPYRYDILQKMYFYIEKIDDLFQLQELDLLALTKQVKKDSDLPLAEKFPYLKNDSM